MCSCLVLHSYSAIAQAIWQGSLHQTDPSCVAGSEGCKGGQDKQQRIAMTAPCCMHGSAGLQRHSHSCATLRRPKDIHTACRTAQTIACPCNSRGCTVLAHGQGHDCSWSVGSCCRRSGCMQQPKGRSRQSSSIAAAPAAQEGAAGLAGLLQAIQAQLQGQAPSGEPAGADLEVQHLTYHPAGAAPPVPCDSLASPAESFPHT